MDAADEVELEWVVLEAKVVAGLKVLLVEVVVVAGEVLIHVALVPVVPVLLAVVEDEALGTLVDVDAKYSESEEKVCASWYMRLILKVKGERLVF